MPVHHHTLVAWQRADDLFIKRHQLSLKALPAFERSESLAGELEGQISQVGAPLAGLIRSERLQIGAKMAGTMVAMAYFASRMA